MFQLKDVRQGIYRSNRNKPTLVKCKGLALLRDRALVLRPRPQQRFKNIFKFLDEYMVYMHRSIKVMHIKTAQFNLNLTCRVTP